VFVDLHRNGEATSLERIVQFMGLSSAPEVIEAVREQFTCSEMRERLARIAEQIAVAAERFAPYADLMSSGADTPRFRWDAKPGFCAAA
jgi:hypothetical protein